MGRACEGEYVAISARDTFSSEACKQDLSSTHTHTHTTDKQRHTVPSPLAGSRQAQYWQWQYRVKVKSFLTTRRFAPNTILAMAISCKGQVFPLHSQVGLTRAAHGGWTTRKNVSEGSDAASYWNPQRRSTSNPNASSLPTRRFAPSSATRRRPTRSKCTWAPPSGCARAAPTS